MKEKLEFRGQLITGSSLAATFGRGRHRGLAELTDSNLTFRDNSGSQVFHAGLTEIKNVSISKLGVLTVEANQRVRICVDDQSRSDQTVIGQGISIGFGLAAIKDFATELEARWKNLGL